jgi:hypothetical protein
VSLELAHQATRNAVPCQTGKVIGPAPFRELAVASRDHRSGWGLGAMTYHLWCPLCSVLRGHIPSVI